MEEKILRNTSKGLLKKLVSKDRITGLALKNSGFAILKEKGPSVEIAFEDLKAAKVDHYFDRMTPFKTLTLLTHDNEEFRLDIEPYSGETEEILKHFAKYQLKGDFPNKIEEFNLCLINGINGYAIHLEKGKLVITKKGERTEYPWSHLEYYRIDKVAQNIHLKFQEKKLFVSISGVNMTNIWLLLEILSRFAKKQ